MTDLPIHITTHHLQLSETLCQFVGKKVTPVKRFANDAVAADIVLRRHGGAQPRFSASARVALPGRDVHSRAVSVDLYTAIGQLVATLARRLRKRKTRLGRTFSGFARVRRKRHSQLDGPRHRSLVGTHDSAASSHA